MELPAIYNKQSKSKVYTQTSCKLITRVMQKTGVKTVTEAINIIQAEDFCVDTFFKPKQTLKVRRNRTKRKLATA